VIVWEAGTKNDPPAAPFVRSLNKIGYQAALHKPFKQLTDYIDALNAANPPAQIGMLGYTDSADGADAVVNMICHGPGNYGNFCDRRITAQYHTAIDLEATDPPAAHGLLAKIDHELVDEAAVVPVWNTNDFALLLGRVGNWPSSLTSTPADTGQPYPEGLRLPGWAGDGAAASLGPCKKNAATGSDTGASITLGVRSPPGSPSSLSVSPSVRSAARERSTTAPSDSPLAATRS
jgi:hypothetical protein